MTESATPPTSGTPAEARRQGLTRARWVAAGAAVGAAVVLTGTVAVVHAAPSSKSNQLVRTDDGVGDDEYVPAQPFQPQTQQPQQPTQQQTPQVQPRTRSGGS
jgi:hypothetical protein